MIFLEVIDSILSIAIMITTLIIMYKTIKYNHDMNEYINKKYDAMKGLQNIIDNIDKVEATEKENVITVEKERSDLKHYFEAGGVIPLDDLVTNGSAQLKDGNVSCELICDESVTSYDFEKKKVISVKIKGEV